MSPHRRGVAYFVAGKHPRQRGHISSTPKAHYELRCANHALGNHARGVAVVPRMKHRNMAAGRDDPRETSGGQHSIEASLKRTAFAASLASLLFSCATRSAPPSAPPIDERTEAGGNSPSPHIAASQVTDSAPSERTEQPTETAESSHLATEPEPDQRAEPTQPAGKTTAISAPQEIQPSTQPAPGVKKKPSAESGCGAGTCG